VIRIVERIADVTGIPFLVEVVEGPNKRLLVRLQQSVY
jgi:hypothetical protein